MCGSRAITLAIECAAGSDQPFSAPIAIYHGSAGRPMGRKRVRTSEIHSFVRDECASSVMQFHLLLAES